jgi:hypothetical protein
MFIKHLKNFENATRLRLQKWNKKNSALFHDMMNYPKNTPPIVGKGSLGKTERKKSFYGVLQGFCLL